MADSNRHNNTEPDGSIFNREVTQNGKQQKPEQSAEPEQQEPAE